MMVLIFCNEKYFEEFLAVPRLVVVVSTNSFLFLLYHQMLSIKKMWFKSSKNIVCLIIMVRSSNGLLLIVHTLLWFEFLFCLVCGERSTFLGFFIFRLFFDYLFYQQLVKFYSLKASKWTISLMSCLLHLVIDFNEKLK